MQKAVILAAGRGTRMKQLTEDRPKPMLEVAGKPILEHVLDGLRAAGLSQALVVTGYRAEAIEERFARCPMDLVFRRQDPLDGTARAALLARDFVGADDFLLTFGDILAGAADYAGMCRALARDAAAVAGVKWVEDPWQGAAVYQEGGRVTEIVEKPPPGSSTTHWNSAGLYVFRPSVFPELERVPKSPRGEYELTSAVAALIRTGERVVPYALQGDWRDVGRPEDLEQVISLVKTRV